MSRTYRFLNSTPTELGLSANWMFYDWKTGMYFNSFSQLARKKIALLYSDKKDGVRRLKGPSWYHKLTAQKPHRSKAKKQIYLFIKSFKDNLTIDDCHEVIIENKPKRDYWY